MKVKELRNQVESISKGLPCLNDKQITSVYKQHRKLTLEEIKKRTDKRKFTDYCYFSLWYAKGDWQIERVFLSAIQVKNRHTTLEHKFTKECTQWFYNVKTHEECFMQRPTVFMGCDFDLNRNMTFRRFIGRLAYSTGGRLSSISGYKKIPGSKLHPKVKLCGFSLTKHFKVIGGDWNKRKVMVNITSFPFYETLIKSNKWRLANETFSEIQLKALQICNRHNIDVHIEDIDIWKDTIRLMNETQMDWHNPKLLADYTKQHKIALKKMEKIREIEKLAKIKTEEDSYRKSHEKYLGIEFAEKNLSFHVLKSVLEFYEEGKHMHHCVYQCGYYKKSDTLIFSVRYGEDMSRLATIEFNLSQRKVLQCRGLQNSKPELYDTILKVFNKNIKKFIEKPKVHKLKEEKLKMAV